MCKSRRELSNAYLLANYCFDTGENGRVKFAVMAQHGLDHGLGRNLEADADGLDLARSSPAKTRGREKESFLVVIVCAT